MAEKKQSFENSLAELEKIVGKLEEGDLALEESLELFEKGIKLSRECQERLNQAEGRIEVLMKDHRGAPALQTLDGQPVESVEVETYQKITFENSESEMAVENTEEDEDDIPF